MVVQIPDVELVTIADAGHLVTLEQPEAVSRAADLTAGPPGGGGGHPGRLQALATPAGQRQPRGEAAGRQAGKRHSGRP